MKPFQNLKLQHFLFNRIAIVLFVICYSFPVCAITNIWIGDEGSWFEPTNWSLNHVPSLGEIVMIPDTVDEVTISGSVMAEANAIHLIGGVLTIADTSVLRIDLQDQTLVGLLVDSGRVDNRGTLTISNGTGSNAYGIHIRNIGLIVNRGELVVRNFFGFNADAIFNEYGSTLDNDGSINIYNIAGIEADGCNNMGLLLNDSSMTIDTVDKGIGLRVSSTGEVRNTNSLSINSIKTTGLMIHGGLFENESGSMLSLADIDQYGIVVENSGILNNHLNAFIRLALLPQVIHLEVKLGSEFCSNGELDITLN